MPAITINDNIKLTITQYLKSTKLLALIGGLNGIIQDEQLAILSEFEKGLSIDKAAGWSLNRIGNNFGFKRPSFPSSDADFFGFDANGTNFDQAPFFYGSKSPLVAIGDVLYRKLLKIWIAGLFYDGSGFEVNKMLSDSLGAGYINDHGDLTATITLVDQDKLTIQAIYRTKVIAKVAGIKYGAYQSLISGVQAFGFGTTGFGANSFVNIITGEQI